MQQNVLTVATLDGISPSISPTDISDQEEEQKMQEVIKKY